MTELEALQSIAVSLRCIAIMLLVWLVVRFVRWMIKLSETRQDGGESE